MTRILVDKQDSNGNWSKEYKPATKQGFQEAVKSAADSSRAIVSEETNDGRSTTWTKLFEKKEG